MLTHKHLKQLGFNRTRNVWSNDAGIIWNRVDGYWRLRAKLRCAKQLEMLQQECYEQQQNTVYETIGGEKKNIWNINIGLAFVPFIRFRNAVFISWYDNSINDKQLKLF